MKLDPTRPRGILTRADREYLLGETEMTHEQSRRNAEARIRERVTNSIHDFAFLVHGLAAKDRRQIFEKSVDDPAFVDGLMAMLSFAYLGCKESNVEFEHLLEPAIRKSEEVYAANTLGTAVDVGVTLDVEVDYGTELDDVTAAIRGHEPVAPAELFSVAIANDPVLAEVETIDLQLTGDGPRDDEGFVGRIADYLDAETTELPLNRIRLRLPTDHPTEERSETEPRK